MDGRAVWVGEDDAVADVSGDDVGGEVFENFERVLGGENGVAGVVADGNVGGAGLFDDRFDVAGVKFAVVFDGDFELGVFGLGFYGF